MTQEEANHNVAFSPSGNYVVDTYSSVDKPPVTVLRSPVDGKVIRKLEEADISGLLATSWRMPEPFTVKARDGITDLYGVMYKPSDFDPAKKYPIIDNIYPGPQTIVRQRNFSPSNGEARARQVHALAELGFIVVHIEAMGTNFRSKAFHDTWYGNMGDNGIPDHIAALKQLGARHSFIDLDRVGIYGHSGGGFASTDAILRYPDFFKVAVSSAGNHDNRSYRNTWAEKYQGLLEKDEATGKDNYENQVNYLLAENLKGKLLLVHGDMDDNVHPAMDAAGNRRADQSEQEVRLHDHAGPGAQLHPGPVLHSAAVGLLRRAPPPRGAASRLRDQEAGRTLLLRRSELRDSTIALGNGRRQVTEEEKWLTPSRHRLLEER